MIPERQDAGVRNPVILRAILDYYGEAPSPTLGAAP